MKEFVLPAVVAMACALLTGFLYQGLEIKGRPSVRACNGPCYEAWLTDNGSVVEQLQIKQAAEAAKSPAALGQGIYTTVCQACHGEKGQGVVGPQISGRTKDYLLESLLAYKGGETRGNQSAIMWSQAATMNRQDMENVAAYIESL